MPLRMAPPLLCRGPGRSKACPSLSGFGLGASGLGIRIWGSRFRAGLGIRIWGLGRRG